MSKVDVSPEKINDFLERGVAEVITRDSVAKKLSSGKALRVKHGVDPSGSKLHLGHASVYLKLRDLQDMGHKIVFLVGGFTGRFGDPTQRQQARTLKSKQDTDLAAKDYIHQISKILDVDRLEIRNNGEWYDRMGAEDLIKLISNFTADQVLERDMFQERKKRGESIQLHETIYPILQGYDSVMLTSDLTVIGTDQIFNEGFGRDLQKKNGQEPQDIVALNILAGLDGKQKMGKSLNNYIAMDDPAPEQFGKIMSLPDHLMIDYFTLLTRIPLEEIKSMAESANPRDLKLKLAYEIVSFFHSPLDAQNAQENFINTFSKKETPQNTETQPVTRGEHELVELVASISPTMSKSEARRLITGGAVDVDGVTIKNPYEIIAVTKPVILKVGKHRFIKIIPQK
ncbi:MAG: tyrosine--tRNA ligase [Parcubacteria group bacterium]|nr:tyrosine--tRNA ligase [Parcubacteria group bacterium]